MAHGRSAGLFFGIKLLAHGCLPGFITGHHAAPFGLHGPSGLCRADSAPGFSCGTFKKDGFASRRRRVGVRQRTAAGSCLPAKNTGTVTEESRNCVYFHLVLCVALVFLNRPKITIVIPGLFGRRIPSGFVRRGRHILTNK